MAATVSLVDLRTTILQRLEKEDSPQLPIPLMNGWINDSGAEFHDHLVSAYGEKYSMKEVQFATVANQAPYAFSSIGAADFYQLHGLDVLQGAYWIPVPEFKFAEREQFQYPSAAATYAWRFQGANIIIAPTPKAVVQFKIYYAPTWTKLVADADTFDTVNSWHELIVADVCIKACGRLDLPADLFMKQKVDMERRLNKLKMMRATSSPPRLVDVNNDDDRFVRRLYGP